MPNLKVLWNGGKSNEFNQTLTSFNLLQVLITIKKSDFAKHDKLIKVLVSDQVHRY